MFFEGSYNNIDYDLVASSEDDDHPLKENIRLLPISNHRSSNGHVQKGSKPIKNGGTTTTFHYRNGVSSTTTNNYTKHLVDSEGEEFNRFSYSNSSGPRRMLRRDRGPSSVDNPNYSGGVIDIGPLETDGNMMGGGERAGSPSHHNALASDEYRRRSELGRRGRLLNACCEILRYACWYESFAKIMIN